MIGIKAPALWVLVFALGGVAQTLECPKEGGDYFIDRCCEKTLSDCIRDKPHCDIALRMERFRQWLLEIGRPCTTITADLDTRYRSLHDTVRYAIDTAGVQFSGPHNPTVDVMMYVSMSCPLCKRLFREIHDSLQVENRKGRVRLFVKPLSATRSEQVLVAAARMGKQSELLRFLAPIKQRFTADAIIDIAADSLGISRSELRKLTADRKTVGLVRRSREEALRNGVEITPTFFINGRRYRSFKDPRWVLDAVDYEMHRLSPDR